MNKGFRPCLTLISIVLLMFSCASIRKTGSVQYEYLQIERLGGGQLDFRIYPGESRSNLNVYVSSSAFQTVDKRFQLHLDVENVDAIDDYYSALNGKIQLKGNPSRSGGLKGSWLSLHFVRGNERWEVSDSTLIQRFSQFENLVRQQIEQK